MRDSPLAPHSATPAELQERSEAVRAGSPFLVWREASGRQRLRRLDASVKRLSIGRGPDNDVSLPWDERTSRLHAELVCVGGEWVVVDDGLSTNGTWVGQERIAGRRRLCDGDVTRVGTTLIAFCAPGAARSATKLDNGTDTTVRITPAQRRVLVALCRPLLLGSALGVPLTNPQLAEELYLSVDAIKTHLKALFAVFGLEEVPNSQKRSALVDRAIRIGIVTARDAS